MKARLPFIVLAALVSLALHGCGGGAHSGGRLTPEQRAIATARLNRAAFAVAGLARRVTRAMPRSTSRLKSVMSAARRTRAVDQGYDTELTLYWTLTTETDGSGRQSLYSDEARTRSGGFFAWPAPEWNGGLLGAFPAVFHSTFHVTGGEHHGLSGTLDMTLDDPTGDNGRLHMILMDSLGERSVGDFDVRNGKITGRQHCRLQDETTYDETDEYGDWGPLITIIFDDHSSETIQTNEDGTETQMYEDPSGQPDVSGTLDDEGVGSYTDSAGQTETIDVDTDQPVDDPDDSRRMRRKR